jgi:hypothetical protein
VADGDALVLGLEEGDALGELLGEELGDALGELDGLDDGLLEGLADSEPSTALLGDADGLCDALALGELLGDVLGLVLAEWDGEELGDADSEDRFSRATRSTPVIIPEYVPSRSTSIDLEYSFCATSWSSRAISSSMPGL